MTVVSPYASYPRGSSFAFAFSASREQDQGCRNLDSAEILKKRLHSFYTGLFMLIFSNKISMLKRPKLPQGRGDLNVMAIQPQAIML
jgi:hypothetical protein